MMFLIQPIICNPTVISEKSLATTPSSSDHLTVGFLVRIYNKEAAKENKNNFPALLIRECVNLLPNKHLKPIKCLSHLKQRLTSPLWSDSHKKKLQKIPHKQDTRFCLFLPKHMRFEMLSPSCRLSHSRGQLDMWSERCIVGSMAWISSGRMATSRPVTDFFSTLASSLYITQTISSILGTHKLTAEPFTWQPWPVWGSVCRPQDFLDCPTAVFASFKHCLYC